MHCSLAISKFFCRACRMRGRKRGTSSWSASEKTTRCSSRRWVDSSRASLLLPPPKSLSSRYRPTGSRPRLKVQYLFLKCKSNYGTLVFCRYWQCNYDGLLFAAAAEMKELPYDQRPIEENVNRMAVEGESARSVAEAINVLRFALLFSGISWQRLHNLG